MRIRAMTLLMGAAVVLAGCGGPAVPSGPAGPCGAGGSVSWYTSQDAVSAQKLAEAFTAKCGIPVVLQTTQALPLLQRFQQEQQAGLNKADVFSTVGYGLAQTAISAELVSKLPPEVIGDFPKRFVQAAGYSFSTRVVTVSITVNTDLVRDGEEPTSWHDLADPKWAGRIGLLDPAKNSTAYQAYWQLRNDASLGSAFIEALAAQRPVLYATSNQQVQAVETGEKAVAITPDDTTYLEIAKGAPLKVINPAEGTATSLNFNMLVKAAPNPAGARAFLAHLAGREAATISSQALYEYSPWPDQPGYPQARGPFGALKLLAVDEVAQAADQVQLAASIAKTLAG